MGAPGDSAMNKLASRKYHLSVFIILSATLFTVFGKLTGMEWTSLVGGIFTVYNGANAYSKKYESKDYEKHN